MSDPDADASPGAKSSQEASASPAVSLAQLSRRFGLPTLQVISYHHGASGSWRLSDGLASYALKLTDADAPAWALDGLRAAGDLEWDAYRAGLAMPEPLRPEAPELGLAALVGGQYAALHRWVEDARPWADDCVGPWLGATLATLHRVAPATTGADLTNRYGLHPLSEWRQWARDAETAELPWAADAQASLALVAELRPLLTEAVQRWQHTACLVHSDISPANVLIAPRGPLLCDFDATPDIPWMEAVHVAVSFGKPDPSVLASYLEAGGAPGPMNVVGLAGCVGAALNWTAYNMWVSLGHRAVPAWRVDEATRRVARLWAQVEGVAGGLEKSATELFSALSAGDRRPRGGSGRP
jgi:hypothetical protein